MQSLFLTIQPRSTKIQKPKRKRQKPICKSRKISQRKTLPTDKTTTNQKFSEQPQRNMENQRETEDKEKSPQREEEKLWSMKSVGMDKKKNGGYVAVETVESGTVMMWELGFWEVSNPN